MQGNATSWTRLVSHVQVNISRYAVLAAAVLTPASVLLGTLAADVGGATALGRALGGLVSGLAVVAGVLKFLEGAKDWQLAKLLGPALGLIAPKLTVTPAIAAAAAEAAESSGANFTKLELPPKPGRGDDGGLNDVVAGEVFGDVEPADPVRIPPDEGDQDAMDRDGITIEGTARWLASRHVPGVLLHSAHDRLTARRLAVEAAGMCLHHASRIHYSQGAHRFDGIAHHLRAIRGQYPTEVDCSAMVTWWLWTATRAWHLDDFANGLGWRAGYTGTLVNHGVEVTNGRYLLADVALYGDPFGASGHTALLVHERHGEPFVVSHGSEAGPFLLPLHYRSDLREVRRLIR